MTVLLALIRYIGVAGCAVVALLAYYEGIPFLSDIPFADRIPIVREVVTGRVASERAKATADASQRCASLAEHAATAAKMAEQARQRIAGGIALEEYRKRLAAARAAEQQANDRLEQEIAENEKALVASGRACLLDPADIEWLRK